MGFFDEENLKLEEVKEKYKLAEDLKIELTSIDDVLQSMKDLNIARQKLSQSQDLLKESTSKETELNDKLQKATQKRIDEEQNVIDAQNEVADALRDHGKDSQEYKDALKKQNNAQRRRNTAIKNEQNARLNVDNNQKIIQRSKTDINNQQNVINRADTNLQRLTNGRLNQNSKEVDSYINNDNNRRTKRAEIKKEREIANAKKAKIDKIGSIANIIETVMGVVGTVVTSNMQKDLNNLSATYQEANADLKANLKIFTNSLKLGSKSISSSMSASFTGIVDGIKEGAQSAAQTSTDNALNALTTSLENDFERLKLINQKKIIEDTKGLKNASENAKQMDAIAGGLATAAVAVQAIPGVGQVTGAVLAVGAGLIKGASALFNSINMKRKEIELEQTKMELEYVENQKEAYNSMVTTIYEGAKELITPVLDLTNKLWTFTETAEDNFRKTSISMGKWGVSADEYVNKLFKEQRNLRLNGNVYLDKTSEDISKLQTQYADNTGFAIDLNHDDIMKSFIMGKFWGDDTIVQLNSGMQLFNHSVSSSNEMFFEMYDTAKRIGISQSKFSKDLIKNLKLAEKHQFKGGVKGLMEMAIWAQKTRFNLDNFDAVLNKIKEGGLEGAITSSAQLQVLGGNFAMGSDPLAMMWESYNDPASYAKRLSKMVEGMGSFNENTGEVTFNMGEQMQLASMAKATGMSVEDLMNIERQRIKGDKINSILQTTNYTEEQKQLIISKATRNENGEWQINGKNIQNLNENDFNDLLPVEQGIYNNVKTIADYLTSRKQMQEGATAHSNAVLADETYETFDNTITELINENLRFLNENITTLNTYTQTAYQYMVDSNELVHEQMTSNTAMVTQAFNALSTLANEKATELTNSANIVAQGLSAITGAAGDVEKALTSLAKSQNIDLSGYGARESEFQAAIEWYKDTGNKEKNGDITDEMRDIRNLYFQLERGEISLTDLQDYLADGTDDWADALHNAGAKATDNKSSITKRDVEALLHAYYGDNWQGTTNTNDSIVSSNGSSMLTFASNITPINDGSVQLAQSDPQDVALFAKTGGPFDTLFNGIFAKINEISNVLPRSMEYIMPLERIFNEISHSKGTANNSKIQIDTVKIELNGKLELSNSNGQSIDIINEIKNNPILLRTLTQLISETMEKNINGGKSTYTGGVVTPRFN